MQGHSGPAEVAAALAAASTHPACSPPLGRRAGLPGRRHRTGLLLGALLLPGLLHCAPSMRKLNRLNR